MVSPHGHKLTGCLLLRYVPLSGELASFVIMLHCLIQRLRGCGAFITTSEAALFELMGDSKHPKFKEIQNLVKTSAPDSGLLTKL